MSFKPLRIFFSGIGGSGMSAIACFMRDRGHVVVGSDRAFDQHPSHPLCRVLRSAGITVVPQDGKGIDASFDFVVFSTAVEPDRPEFIRAQSLGIRVKTRPEYLAEIVSDFRTIAIAGTSGKSTSAGMLAYFMERLGLRPNFIGGGRVKAFTSGTHPGNSMSGDSDLLVVEACESDGTIVNYRPLHSVLLNLALDHHSVAETSAMFSALAGNTSGKVFINADDPHLDRIRSRAAAPVTFSVDAPSDFLAADVTYRPLGSEFSVQGIQFLLSLPGKYNVYNALACIAVLSETGVPLQDVAAVSREFEGIERRFDILLDDGKKLVIDDYAHNPHKISALMEAMKTVRERVCYIFQPHGFGPTRLMKDGYIEAFTRHLRGSDHLILLPIFYAGGTAARDISSHDLAEGIRAQGGSVEVVERREVILERVRERDAYVVLGARDETLSDFARAIAKAFVTTSATKIRR
jgi:UDP-N-acetylmuramate--alanine ligase